MSKEVQRFNDLHEPGKRPVAIPVDDPRYAEKLIAIARQNENKRFLLLHHDGDWETAHRMDNAILPESYAAPHQHRDKVQTETYDPIYGEAAVCYFNDKGDVDGVIFTGGDHGRKIVEIKPRTWHTIVALTPFVMREIKGQTEEYDPRYDKKFAPWAPTEGTFVDRLTVDFLREVVQNPEKREGSGETLRRLSIASAVADGLTSAYRNHLALGESGRRKIKGENQFGDNPLRGDIQAEQHVLEGLKKWAKNSQSYITVNSEELGLTEYGRIEGDGYFATLDGLDGTSNYARKEVWPYGTMVAVAKGEDPNYEDFEVAGMMMPEEGWIVLAIKDSGVFVHEVDSKKTHKLPEFDQNLGYDDKKILSDDYFQEAKDFLGNKAEVWPRTGSTAATVTAIAAGEILKDESYPNMNKGWQGLVDVTRKGNLEQPIMYMVMKELGGEMVDRNARDIGKYGFNTWGQDKRVPVILTKNVQILSRILTELSLANK